MVFNFSFFVLKSNVKLHFEVVVFFWDSNENYMILLLQEQWLCFGTIGELSRTLPLGSFYLTSKSGTPSP